MKIIEQSHEIINFSDDTLQQIEIAGRTCYQSQDKITEDSAEKFVAMLQKRKHMAMVEFADMTVRFITNRGVTHELVRHRLCSFAQESTRYVKYDGNMEFIRPIWSHQDLCGEYVKDVKWSNLEQVQKTLIGDTLWLKACDKAEKEYQALLKIGWRPEQAREVLPNALKTEICMKTNIRDWLHIFSLRTSKAAHPQMRALMIGLLNDVGKRLPTVFGEV